MANVDEGNNSKIEMYIIIDNMPVKAGFLNYDIGKGFWKDRQANLHNIEVDETFRGNGLATYALAYLTEIAIAKRVNVIDGKFFPTTHSAHAVYDKNCFVVEREYYDTRIVKDIKDSDIENLKNNIEDIKNIKIYSEHTNFYVAKYNNNHKSAKLSKEKTFGLQKTNLSNENKKRYLNQL